MTELLTEPAAQLLQRYAAAVAAKDANAFAALYAPDALVFDLWNRFSARGREGQRAMAAAWFGSLGDERVAVSHSGLQQQAAPGLIAAQAFVRFTALAADGQVLRSLCNRLSWVLVPADAPGADGAAWQVLHEHTSVPLDGQAQPMFEPPNT